jgi:outer membrane protein assembly factor BamB
MQNSFIRMASCAALLGCGIVLAGCGGGLAGLNPFKEKEIPLPGDRISIMKPQDALAVDSSAAKRPVSIPAPKANASWSQPGGTPGNAPGHLSLQGAGRTVWRASAGTGSSSDGRLTASPIVHGDRIYTLDAEGAVSAFSTANGDRAWRIDLTPENEDSEEGFGGGLAFDNGKLIAVTGFGTVVGLNPASGEVLWKKSIGAPIRSSPTAARGKVFFVTTDSRLYCLSTDTGAEVWTYRGLSGATSLLSNVSPAVSGDTLVVPFTSGDLIGYKISEGRPVWVDSLSRRRGGSALAALSDPSRPVIEKDVVFAVGHSGRMIAISAKTGARRWTANVRGTQTPWVAGNSVFVVDINGKLMALSRDEGKVRWITDLPESSRWNGPTLAGGRLWLASAAGLLVSVNPMSGKIIDQRDLNIPIYISPVVASGRMYILSDKARLYAIN